MSVLADDTAETLLIEHLKTCVGSYGVAWPNVRYSPTVDSPHYRTAFIYPDPERLTHSNSSMHKGIFQVDAVVPANTGNVTALTMARTVAEHFDNQKISGDNVTVEIIKNPALGPGMQETDWYFIPVSIFYTIMN